MIPITTDQLFEDFLRYLRLERGLAETTVATYRHHLKNYLAHLAGIECATPAVTKEIILGYMGVLRERRLRPATIFCASVSLRLFHRFLIARGHADFDPTADIRLPKLTTKISEPLSVKNIERLIEMPSKRKFTGLRDRAILELLFCGTRLGETLGLDAPALHLQEGYAKMVGKGDRERLVPIGKKTIEALERYLDARNKRLGLDEGPLFISQRGRRLTKSGFWRAFKRYARKAGIPRAHPHLLRHSYAVIMLAGRVDMRTLQLLLGHSSLATTQKYLNLDWAGLRETCQRAHPRF